MKSDNATEKKASKGETKEQGKHELAEPLCEEFKFKNQWTLWEHYETDDYMSSMMEICWFNDLASFSVAWNSVPHKDLKQIFYNGDQQKVRYHMVNGKETRINGLSLFLSELHPSYEDEVNKHGGEFRIDFKSNLVFLQQLWEKLLISVITNEFVNTDLLAGIRLLDKSTSTRENFFRIEIWTKFSDSEVALKEEMQKHLEDAYILKMRENDYTFNSSKNRDRDAPLSDWIKFNNHSKDNKGSYHQQQPKEAIKEEARD